MQSGILLIPQAQSRKGEGKDNTSHLLIRAGRPAGLGGFVQLPEVAPAPGARSDAPASPWGGFMHTKAEPHGKRRLPAEAPLSSVPTVPIHPCPAGGARPRGRFPRAAPTRPRGGRREAAAGPCGAVPSRLPLREARADFYP